MENININAKHALINIYVDYVKFKKKTYSEIHDSRYIFKQICLFLSIIN